MSEQTDMRFEIKRKMIANMQICKAVATNT